MGFLFAIVSVHVIKVCTTNMCIVLMNKKKKQKAQEFQFNYTQSNRIEQMKQVT